MEPDKQKKKPSEEDLKELEELIETLKKLEEEKRKSEKNNKNNRGKMFVIEFGGVFHRNIIINLLFTFVMNVSLSYLIIELFGFAEYSSILTYIAFIALYTLFEGLIKTYMTIKLFKWIIQSMGFILYLVYISLFYVLDIFLFKGNSFTFTHEYHIVAFVTIFVIVRYFVGTNIKRYLRTR